MLTRFLILLPLILPFFKVETLEAQDYLRNSIAPVARHDRRNSRVPLRDSRQTSVQEAWGMLFEEGLWSKEDSEEARLVSYRELPTCSKSEVRLLQIDHHSMATDGIDITYYSPNDAAQKREAKKRGDSAVPYYPALMRDPQSMLTDPGQEFARFLQIPCLPARFRFTFVGNQRYAEFRLGKAAWEATEAAK